MRDVIFKIILNIFKSWKKYYFDFSQFGEEKVLFNIFQRISSKKKLNNTYIDIGGFDPIKFSNTYKLYQKNWSGLVIEPNKDKTINWKKIRPRDHVISSAVVEKSYEKKVLKIFFDKKNSAMSTAYPLSNVDKLGHYDASVIKFNEIISMCKNKYGNPSFLNIDIEGNEEKILMELKDLNFIIPVICAEIFLEEKKMQYSVFDYKDLPVIMFLEEIGYYLININGPSLIFCHKDYWIPYSKL